MSPIELFWTAKNNKNLYELFRKIRHKWNTNIKFRCQAEINLYKLSRKIRPKQNTQTNNKVSRFLIWEHKFRWKPFSCFFMSLPKYSNKVCVCLFGKGSNVISIKSETDWKLKYFWLIIQSGIKRLHCCNWAPFLGEGHSYKIWWFFSAILDWMNI